MSVCKFFALVGVVERFIHQPFPAVLIPPPPWTDPRALGFFFKTNRQIPHGGDKRAGQMPHGTGKKLS